MSLRVGAELRGIRLIAGGRGVIIVARSSGRWLSTKAYAALERAAERLGYAGRGGPWSAVVRAVDDWALDDVISEAVEEQEGYR